MPEFTAPTGAGHALAFGVGRDGMCSEMFGRTDRDNGGPFGFSFDRWGDLLTTLFVGGPVTAAVGSMRDG